LRNLDISVIRSFTIWEPFAYKRANDEDTEFECLCAAGKKLHWVDLQNVKRVANFILGLILFNKALPGETLTHHQIYFAKKHLQYQSSIPVFLHLL
jgi:hypothetical protein